MKANLPGLALAASAALFVSATGAIPSESFSLALPGEEIPLGDRVVLFAPTEPALTLLEGEGTLPCPAIHASLAGDLCERGSLALPGEEAPLGDRVVLFAPTEPALTLPGRKGILPCPVIHASLAGDLCERGSAPAPLGLPPESHLEELSGEASTLAEGLTAPEPGTAFLAALAGCFLFTVRRRTIS